MIAKQIFDGARGFDCNVVLSAQEYNLFKGHNYDFTCRYIPRITPKGYDLTPTEVLRIMDSGLGLMPVQHVEAENGWIPSITKGQQYGEKAADYCTSIGISQGTNIWLDLEGVDRSVHDDDIIEYCNYWYRCVAVAGFVPGIYLGWHNGLTARQAYYRLEFEHYWAAYNLNMDEEPIVRGCQMRQKVANIFDFPDGIKGIVIDVNIVRADKLAGLPIAMFAE
jgi:glycoside hydrolase-like protein